MYLQHAYAVMSNEVYVVQIMQMSRALHELSAQRAQQLAAQAKPQYQTYTEIAKAHSTALGTSLAALQAKSADANKRTAEGQTFRGNCLQAYIHGACRRLLSCSVTS